MASERRRAIRMLIRTCEPPFIMEKANPKGASKMREDQILAIIAAIIGQTELVGRGAPPADNRIEQHVRTARAILEEAFKRPGGLGSA